MRRRIQDGRTHTFRPRAIISAEPLGWIGVREVVAATMPARAYIPTSLICGRSANPLVQGDWGSISIRAVTCVPSASYRLLCAIWAIGAANAFNTAACWRGRRISEYRHPLIAYPV